MTRMRTVGTLVLFVVCALTTPFAVHAQADRPVHFGVMGGATIPRDLLNDAAKSGWSLGALVSFDTPLEPLSFRIDGQWIHLPGRSGNFIACGLTPDSLGCPEPIGYDFRVIDGTANAVYTFGSGLPTGLYVIAGAGVYGERTTSTFDHSRSSATKFGLNGGIGVKFRIREFGGFVEARYHNVIHGSDIGDYAKHGDKPRSLQFFPISAGITF
jgi:hypothetical protein